MASKSGSWVRLPGRPLSVSPFLLREAGVGSRVKLQGLHCLSHVGRRWRDNPQPLARFCGMRQLNVSTVQMQLARMLAQVGLLPHPHSQYT